MAVSYKDTDTWNSNINGLPYGLYLYYIDSLSPTLSSVIGASGSNVFSCFYAPYVKSSDLDMNSIPYDTKRFGDVSAQRPELITNPNVYRINSILNGSRFFKYRPYVYNVRKAIGGVRDWRNESKLYTYPYSYITLYDGVNEPMNLKPQYCRGKYLDIGVKMCLDDKLTTGLFVQNYKGDTHGRFEAQVMGVNLELPCTSSNYANFISTSRSTLLAQQQAIQSNFITNQQIASNNYEATEQSSILNAGMGAVGAIGNLLSMNFGGAVTGALGTGAGLMQSRIMNHNAFNNSALSNSTDKMNAQRALASSVADSKTTPNTLMSKGADIMYGLRNSDKYLKLFRFRQRDEYMEVLGDFFAMYGYAQNRIMRIDTRSRYYYNYVKTRSVSIKTKSIPNQYLEKLKSIYNNGVTIWHVDRGGVDPLDYTYDNYEV